MKKVFLISFFIAVLFAPFIATAQAGGIVFEAEVIKILEARDLTADDGVVFHQQNLQLVGLEKEMQGTEFIVEGISDFEVAQDASYDVGDKVVVMRSSGPGGEPHFYITDYVRRMPLLLLTIVFVLVVLSVARFKGLRALIVLLVTFFIIIKGVIPLILQGYNPIVVSITGALLIAALAIFGTEGFNKKSYVSYVSLVLSLVVVMVLSFAFSTYSRLTGVTEESAMLLSFFGDTINLQGLLLAGIIFGAIGVLDDIVISQVSTVQELLHSNPNASAGETFKRAMRVGTDHINALVNTLFLAYTGAALPLLIIFTIQEPPFVTFRDAINNEILATEIVRTLSGSIALVLAVPIATSIALAVFNKEKHG